MAGRILILSDSAKRMAPLTRALGRAYFETDLASFVAAGAALRRASPDLILVDARGCDADAAPHDALGRVRDAVDTPLIYVVDRADQAAHGFRAGADDIIWDALPPDAACGRIRALSRLRAMSEEVRLREETSLEFGLASPQPHEGRLKILFATPRGHAPNAALVAAARRLGADLTLASSGVRALAAAGTEAPDLAIVDFGLAPVEDPIALAAAMEEEIGGGAAVLTLGRQAGSADLALEDGAAALAARMRGQLRLSRLARRLSGGFESGLRLAATDALTGFFNRRYLEAHFGRLFDTAQRDGGALAVLMIDIDFFKSVNDRFGHAAGDAVLRALADRLRGAIRRCDFVARVGGDEFLVAMPDETAERAMAAAERIRRAVAAAPILSEDGTLPAPSLSIGVAALRRSDQTADALLRRADHALLEAKRMGRSRVAPHQNDVGTKAADRVAGAA